MVRLPARYQPLTSAERWMQAMRFRSDASARLDALPRIPESESSAALAVALADAVAAMKASLQGFIAFQLELPDSTTSNLSKTAMRTAAFTDQTWRLIKECKRAGLGVGGLRIQKLSDIRNVRFHETPAVGDLTLPFAITAVRNAYILQIRINSALQRLGDTTSTSVVSTPDLQRAISAIDRSFSQVLVASPLGPVLQPDVEPEESAGDTGPDILEEDDDNADSRAKTYFWRRRLIGYAAVALIFALTGGGIASALTSTPLDRLPFVTLPATSVATATAVPTAMPTLVPTPAIVVAGSLVASAPVCQAGQTTVQLRNTGATPIEFSAGSPDAPSAAFALTPDAPGQPTTSGTIEPASVITLYVVTVPSVASYHIDVLAPAGTVQLSASAC